MKETSNTLPQAVLFNSEQIQYYQNKLLRLQNFEEAFELVKKQLMLNSRCIELD